MVNPRTRSRARKMKLLRDTLNNIVEIMLLQHKDRDNVFLREFKELFKLSEEIRKQTEKPEIKTTSDEAINP